MLSSLTPRWEFFIAYNLHTHVQWHQEKAGSILKLRDVANLKNNKVYLTNFAME
jgi:hypothetical protein